MSYDLAIWDADLPADEATFNQLFDEYLSGHSHPPTAKIQAYARALEAKFPDPESEQAPWSTGSIADDGSGPLLYVAVVYSQAGDVAKVAAQLAAEHGLIFFDPQVGGPRGVTVTTAHGSVRIPDRWLPFVSSVLRNSDDYVIVDDGGDNSYAQARNDANVLTLEYRDGSPQRHYQVEGVGIDDVAEALEQWAEGRRDFIPRHEWQRLDYWD